MARDDAGAPPGAEYDPLAGSYHWLMADEWLATGAVPARRRPLLDALPAGARVLDCACGIGLDAVALARAGLAVSASDASGALVAEARRRAEAAGVDAAFAVCRWDELPARFAEPFALVLCTGNALSHCLDEAALAAALAGMRAVTAPGGALLVDSRDWDALWRERPRASHPARPVERGGERCTPLYLWSYPEPRDGPQRLEIVLLLERDGLLRHERHELTYRPWRRAEVEDALRGAGFAELELDAAANPVATTGWWEMLAR